MTNPNNTDANSPDTTVGGGSDYTPGSDDPNYVAPPSGAGAPVEERDTTATPGGTSNSNTGAGGPAATEPETSTQSPLGGAGRTGDTDSHTRDPNTAEPDTTVGGGGIGSTAAPAYRTSTPDAPGDEKDTSTTYGGTGGSTAGSPDAAKVGGVVNPNAAEPGLTNSAYASGNADTSYIGSSPGGNAPANDGTPTSAPTGVTAVLVADRSAVTVSWTPPANAAATKVTRYVVESNTQGTEQAPANATSVEFEQGLIPGQTYTFTVYAETTQGSGRRSAASAPVTIPSHGNLAADTTRADGL